MELHELLLHRRSSSEEIVNAGRLASNGQWSLFYSLADERLRRRCSWWWWWLIVGVGSNLLIGGAQFASAHVHAAAGVPFRVRRSLVSGWEAHFRARYYNPIPLVSSFFRLYFN